jgi:osmotically inducible lipoprotein OsmB
VGHRTDCAAVRSDNQFMHNNSGDFCMNHFDKTRGTASLVALALTFTLGACGSMSERDKNTTTGAVIGGAAGAILSGGGAAATVGGAAVGGVIGNQVDPKKK